MNYKEKYETALEGIQEILDSGQDSIKMSRLQLRLQGIFPELKESEDEKIRKVISDILLIDSDEIREILDANNILMQDIDAWLEKQGEQKPVEWGEEDENECNHILKILNLVAEEQETKGYNNLISSVNWLKSLKDRIQSKPRKKNIEQNLAKKYGITGIGSKHAEGKLGEMIKKKIETENVDNTNKVEPKFHEGDWVVSNKIGVLPWLIIEVTSTHYVMVSYRDCKVMVYLSDVDNDYHLWIIQDAKDGDIIYAESKFNTFDFISIFSKFENEKEKSWAYCHVHSDCEDLVHWSFDKCAGFVNLYNYDFYPATKEQRDLLFQKMKEAGYEWDSEKKELKKIE